MNKSIATLAGGLILSAVGLQALAQNQPGRPPITQTSGSQPANVTSPGVVPVRTAVLNVNKVLKNFNKAQQLNKFISDKVNAYGAQINAKREEVTKLQAEIAKSVDPAQAEQLKKRGVQLEREMQDLDAEARKDISAQQGTIAVGIYRDIEGVIQRVAVANGFDLVMSYPDATTESEMYSQPNVVRKLAAQAAIPLYYKPHIDITDAVVQTLNATFPVAAASPSAGATPPAMQAHPSAQPLTPPAAGQPQPKRQ